MDDGTETVVRVQARAVLRTFGESPHLTLQLKMPTSTDLRFLLFMWTDFDCNDDLRDVAALTQPFNLLPELQQDPLGPVQDVPGRGVEQTGRRAAPADTGLGLGAGGR